jgi:flagellar protein FliO/FliZ
MRGSVALGLGLLLGTIAFAADENQVFTPGATRAAAPGTSTGGSLNSLSLIFGVALAAAGGWMVWRNRRGAPVGRDLRALSVDETRALGNRQYLVVASYEGRKFLLGVCPGRIEMLSPLDGSPLEKGRE